MENTEFESRSVEVARAVTTLAIVVVFGYIASTIVTGTGFTEFSFIVLTGLLALIVGTSIYFMESAHSAVTKPLRDEYMTIKSDLFLAVILSVVAAIFTGGGWTAIAYFVGLLAAFQSAFFLLRLRWTPWSSIDDTIPTRMETASNPLKD